MIIYTLQQLTQHDMFILGKFWKDNTGGSLNLSNDGAADLMWRELGIDKHHYAAKRFLEVLEDPKMVLEKYKDDLDKISTNMSKQFQDDLKDLLEIGYSPQHAKQLALNKAEGWIEYQMAILDKKFPLVNDQALLRDTVAGKLVVQIDARVQKKQRGSGKSKAHGRNTTRSLSRKGGALTQSISGSQSGSGISQAFSQMMP